MNTELEGRLRADMEQFTRDIRVPAGLSLQAYRHNRKRRLRIRVAVASGAATAVTAGAVAIAGVAGAFGPASPGPTTQTARTTAYVLQQVENALAPASVANLIDFSRTVFPPGVTEQPVVGGSDGGSTNGGASSPWSVGYLLHWGYQGSQRDSGYSPGGKHVFDIGISAGNGSATQTTVIYGSSTWWTATVPAAAPGSSGCAPEGSIQLSSGPGNGWPAFIRSQLACGAYTMAGHQVMDGIDAIKITGPRGLPPLVLFVDPATYLPIQLNIGPLGISFQWLPTTPANLAQLKVPVPPGFRQVPPPARN
jgi:hypothetical protein